jgi:hypothetical protein
MDNVKKMNNCGVICELMELVAKVRRGDVVSVTVVTTGCDGVVSAKKLCEPSQLDFRYIA